jgi:hypothetical protein
MKRTSKLVKKPDAGKALRELRDACNQQSLTDDDLSRVVGGVCGWNQTKQMNPLESDD